MLLPLPLLPSCTLLEESYQLRDAYMAPFPSREFYETADAYRNGKDSIMAIYERRFDSLTIVYALEEDSLKRAAIEAELMQLAREERTAILAIGSHLFHPLNHK